MVIGYDMRDSSPSLAAAFADGVVARASTSSGSGSPPPTSSTSPPACWTAPARCSPPATTRPPTTASSCAGRRQARRQGHRSDHHQRRGDRRCARIRRSRRHDHRPRCAGRLRRIPALAGRFDGAAPAAGRRRRRERHGRPHRARGARDRPVAHVLPLYFELDGTFPNHEANPLDPANLVDLQRTWSPPAPTSAWRSTATPTAVSSSTNKGSRYRRQR